MIDEKLYCETFSRLRASEKAKEEVFHKMKNKTHARRLPKLLRTAAIAAVMAMALAVTAGAVNYATDGALFRQFRIAFLAVRIGIIVGLALPVKMNDKFWIFLVFFCSFHKSVVSHPY